jgi:hypothetical protein
MLAIAIAGLLPVTQGALAANSFFEPSAGVTNGSTFSWDDPNWSATATAGSGTLNWTAGNFPEFPAGGTGISYIVNVGQDESVAGVWMKSAGTLTIDQTASTTGDLNMATGVQGILLSGALVVNAPIVGSGGIEPEFEASGAAVSLFGNNTYSGGTLLTSSSTLVNFNNNNSFGASTISAQYAAGSFAPLIATGGSTITLPNNWQNTGTGGGVNFASSANTPVITTGTWTLGSVAFNLRNNGNSTAPLTLSGAISGSSSLVLSGANGGTIIVKGPNTFSGTVTTGIVAGTENKITLKLGAANTLTDTTGVTLSGGTLDPDGFTQSMTSAPLSMTASTAIDYEAGASEVDFANSSAATWTGTLNLANWDATGGTTLLRFGTDATGLTAGQLAEIEFSGNAATLGTAGITSTGYVVETPEPATLSLLALAGFGLVARRRRTQA